MNRLNSTISSDSIERIEQKYNFTLPVEYREFISKIGNGGILPEQEGDFTELVAFNENLGLNHVQEEFPLADSWNYKQVSGMQSQLDEFLSIPNKGYIQIASINNCNNSAWLLIITGIRRGEVWLKDEYGILRFPNNDFFEWLSLYLSNKLPSRIGELSEQERAKEKTDSPLKIITKLMDSKCCESIRWNSPVSTNEVEDFERINNITLPVEYVEFITKVADGCSNFRATNSKGKGGTMFRLREFSALKKLGVPFLFDRNTEEIRSDLIRNYDRQHTIWQSEFPNLATDEEIPSIWASPEYSQIPGVLPFAIYNDTGTFGMNTQALLVLNGPLKGQIWKATKFRLIPDGEQETFYTWLIRMMEDGVI